MTTDQLIAVAGVVISALGPMAVVAVAFLANKRFKHFERSLEEQRRVSDTRFQLYKDIAFQLNDIYAYFTFVGDWKKYRVRNVVALKRQLDRHVYSYRPLFTETFNDKYDSFIAACFQTYGEWGRDARLRTTAKYRREEDKAEFADCFTEEDNQSAIKACYRALLACLAEDLGISPARAAQ